MELSEKSAPSVAHYVLAPQHSQFTVHVFATGMLSMFAHNPIIEIRNFSGELYFSPEQIDKASFHMTVDARSLEVTGNVKPKDREEIQMTMHREVLESHRYPEIIYRSRSIAADAWFRLRIMGELNLHGVTRPHNVESQLRLYHDGVRLSGEFSLRHSVYNLKRVSALGGMITVKDELRLSFEIVGLKQEP
jgi:polyisoprenoid-binding protein YceI